VRHGFEITRCRSVTPVARSRAARPHYVTVPMNFAAAQDGRGPAAYAQSAPDNFRPRAFETRDQSREARRLE
jgi:hypothetical protein